MAITAGNQWGSRPHPTQGVLVMKSSSFGAHDARGNTLILQRSDASQHLDGLFRCNVMGNSLDRCSTKAEEMITARPSLRLQQISRTRLVARA